MAVTRNQLLKRIWIESELRLPPDTDKGIFGWDARHKKPFVTTGKIYRAQCKQKQRGKEIDDKVKKLCSGYQSSHWAPVIAPEEVGQNEN